MLKPMSKSNRHRIAHIIPELVTDDTGIMLRKLVSHIDLTEFEPIVVVLGKPTMLSAALQADGITVYCLNLPSGVDKLWGAYKLHKLISNIAPDILQGWTYQGNIIATLANKLHKPSCRVFWNIRQTVDNFQREPWATRKMIKLGAKLSTHAERIIYDSYLSADQHVHLGYPEAKTEVLPNGFDTQVFCPNTQTRQGIRQRLGIPEHAPVIGMVANFQPPENYAAFMAAAKLLGHHKPDVHFVLAGKDTLPQPDGQHPANTHLLGEISDVAEVLNALDIFTMAPSNDEGFPNIIAEAMACGIPCIAAEVGDAGHLIGSTGKLLEAMTPSTLAFAWWEWLDAGDVWRKDRGRQAMRRIRKHYSIDTVAKHYQEVYRKQAPTETEAVA